MTQEADSFWQANFWGIVGTISGLSGIFISWLTYKYNTPGIEIDKMSLIVPDEVIKEWKGKSVKELKSSFLDFYLEIVVRNRSGGAGSIDKPNLLIKIPAGKKLIFLPKFRTIAVYPITEHKEFEKESENITRSWTVRHGRAFNLGAGEKVDEKLEYEVEKADMIQAIVQNYDKIQYFVEYWDNKGRRREVKVEKILKESELS